MADERDDEPREDTRTPEEKARDEKDLQAARDEWKLSDEYFREQREKEKEDLKFEAGQHWTEEELAWKRDHVEPAFVIDQLSGPINKTANAPVPQIVVTAVGQGADPVSAQYWQGICRRVENLSGATSVYRWARLHAIKAGRGFYRIRADHFGQMERRQDGRYDLGAFDQDIRIEPILNQHAVYEDPRCRQLDFSDMRFCIITEDIEWSEFRRRWPHAQFSQQSVFPHESDAAFSSWRSVKSCTVAERYYIEDETFTLCLLVDGRVVEKAPGVTYPPEQVKDERVVRVPRVKWMRFTAAEVLERADVPGRYIPVIKIVGERRFVDGKEDNRGMVRMARDPQRLVSFMESRLAKAVDEDAWSTIMAEASTVAEFEDEWTNIHIQRPALVRWRGTSTVDGKALPKPEVIRSSPDVGAIALAATRATMGLRATLGVPDVTPQELRPEQSGKAIVARQNEQAQTTSHYADSLDAGVRLGGKVIMSMARGVYTMPRIMRIIGKDEREVEVVTHDGPAQVAQAQSMAQPPQQPSGSQVDPRHLLDLSIGDFDVSVSAGKGYESGRQATVESLTAMIQAYPPMAPLAVPIILKSSDFPGAQELAAALDPEQQQKVPPEVQERLVQLDQYAKAATEQVQQLQGQVNDKTADRESKERIELAKIESQFRMEQLKFQHELALKQLDIQADIEKAKISAEASRDAMFHQSAHEQAMRDSAPPSNRAGA